MYESLVATSAQKVLAFLIRNPGKQFLANEIQRATRISRGGVNVALRTLAREKLVSREKKAKIYLYSVDDASAVIKQLKVLQTVTLLQPLVSTLKELCQRIVLFGSCARGENVASSDIDLFILTNSAETVQEQLRKSSLGRKLQPVVRNATELARMQKEEDVFFGEIERGIPLWESRDESRI